MERPDPGATVDLAPLTKRVGATYLQEIDE
jgi:hypothetical protein